jgi:hypothetical protein
MKIEKLLKRYLVEHGKISGLKITILPTRMALSQN